MTSLHNNRLTINPRTIYSILVALIPILSPYASPFYGVYLEEFLLLIMTGIAIFFKDSVNTKKRLFFINLLGIEIVFSVIFNVLFQYGQTTDVIIRSIRMLFYIVVICFTSSRLLDLKKTMKAVVFISLCSVVFLFIQIIIYRTTGKYIKGMGNFLPLAYRANFDYQYYMNILFRPSSIFSEPAAMCEYLVIPLSYLLLGEQDSSNHRLIKATILSFGCLLTTSLWGIVIVIVMWSVWLIKTNAIKKYFLVLVFILPIILYYVINSAFFSNAMGRIDISSVNSIISSESFAGRFLGYDSLANLHLFDLLLGKGFGHLGIRSQLGTGNSVVYYLLGLGVLGTAIFYISSVFELKRIESLWQKVIFSLMLILSFGAGIMNTCLIMYFVIISVYSFPSEE